MYPRVFFSLSTDDCRAIFFPLYSQGRRWWKKCGSYVLFSPRNEDFSLLPRFLSSLFIKKEKISTKNRKMSQTMKSFSFFFHFSFNKDFPLILTDAILINFHLLEYLKGILALLAFSMSTPRCARVFHEDLHIAMEINLQPCESFQHCTF